MFLYGIEYLLHWEIKIGGENFLVSPPIVFIVMKHYSPFAL